MALSVGVSNTQRRLKSGWLNKQRNSKRRPNSNFRAASGRELLLQRARRAETASHISDWVRSRELQAPK